MICEPDDTTCKYLHRKDLPRFVVDEATGEHAAEWTERIIEHARAGDAFFAPTADGQDHGS